MPKQFLKIYELFIYEDIHYIINLFRKNVLKMAFPYPTLRIKFFTNFSYYQCTFIASDV
jgi:hypothetical protein